MGPRDQKLAQGDAAAPLLEKDRIATLETRLEAYSARASTAHARLLKTIDVLDALRSQHALEISAEEQAKMNLVQEVNRWCGVAKSLEVERDELKDVVEDLIEKGNLNVEFLEQVPVDARVIDSAWTNDDHNNDLLAYAASIITRLRMELDVERQNHSRSVDEANLRIEELEAKVAVREAELENCVIADDDNAHLPEESQNPPIQKRKPCKKLPEPRPLSDEECLRLLESNSARNRSLEIEIRQIAEKLEQARMAVLTSSGSRGEPQLSAIRNSNKDARTPSPRTRSASVDPNALSRRPSDAGRATSTPVLASPSTMLSIAQLDNQIRTMTTQMEGLVSERTMLIEAAARQRRVTDSMTMDSFQDVLRVEGECVRLQAEVDDLQEQLQHARSSARAREKALVREIAQLRATLSTSSDLQPAQDLYHVQPLEDDIAAEESMELASPLMPTVIPNPNPISIPPSHALGPEADLMASPFSPGHVSSLALEDPPTPTCTSPGPQDIDRVQAALDAARTHLAQKEEALVQLRAEMERLQREIQVQTQSGQDGN